jgi:RNA polymerase II subunit A-like phosphatase
MVALAMPKDLKNGDEAADTTATAAAAKHKRPTKRKRPPTLGAGSVAGVNAKSGSAGGETTINAAAKGQSAAYTVSAIPLRMPKIAPASKAPKASSIASQSRLHAERQQLPIVAEQDGIVRMGTGKHAGGPSAIGSIEQCKHPAVIGKLCASCGTVVESSLELPTGEDFASPMETEMGVLPSANMSRMTVGGFTITVSEEEGRRMAQEDAERLRGQRKLSLVLDLDHTLVHATSDIRAQQHFYQRDDVRSLILPMMSAEQQQPGFSGPVPLMQHFIKLRPHIKEFLESSMELYEIGVYTAGTREYAEQITIILARHLLGNTHDQVDLDQLRYKLAQAEAEAGKRDAADAAKQERKKAAASELRMDADAQGKTKGTGEASGEKEELANGPVQDEKLQKKRKRVCFEEKPPSKVERLRAQLEEAERQEKKAVELRKRLFGSRVVSRTDVSDLGHDVKSLKRIFPCGGSMAAVVDDREDVWANATDMKSTRRGEPPENLLLVRPYHWGSFLGFADVNNASGVDLSGLDNEQSEADEQLLWVTDILKRLHHRYYSYDIGPDRPSVPEILEKMRREVFKGHSMVLSGLVPLHKQNVGPDEPRHPFVRYAESLGATLLPNVTDAVTHVVASKDGTDKVLAARRLRNCQVVKPSWLMECYWTLTYRDEQPHLLGPSGRDKTLPPTNSVLADSMRDNSSSSSDEDDDLVAEFEKELMESQT